MNNFIYQWNILRARRVFHLENKYTFNLDPEFHPRLTVNAPDSEFASFLYLHGEELLKDILINTLPIRPKKKNEKLEDWVECVFQTKSDLNFTREQLIKFILNRNEIAHEGKVLNSVTDFYELLGCIESLLLQFEYIDIRPDYNELVWFFDSSTEPLEVKGVFVRNGSYGVQVAQTGKPVYYYTFEVHYKDEECNMLISQAQSKLKVDF